MSGLRGTNCPVPDRGEVYVSESADNRGVAAGGGVVGPMPVPGDLLVEAAGRLTPAGRGQRMRTGRQFVEQAGRLGIDLRLMRAVVHGDGRRRAVGQVCLPVAGAGRTAMFFVSGPASQESEADRAERVAVVQAGFEAVRSLGEGAVRLCQALPEPGEVWAIAAYEAAGFSRIGPLDYMRRPLHAAESGGGVAPIVPSGLDGWPGGVEVRSCEPGERDEALVARALEVSYEGTMDCPELCGLRETADVLVSHRATGRWEPCMWWLALREGEPVGCVLLNPCPEIGSVELVYLGLSPAVRGVGLADALLRAAISASAARGGELTCAVDRRNAPACGLYVRHGFRRFAERIALVRAL